MGTLNTRCRTIIGTQKGTQKGTLILTTTHMDVAIRALDKGSTRVYTKAYEGFFNMSVRVPIAALWGFCV